MALRLGRLGGAAAFARRTLHQADRHNILFLASALTFDGLLAAIPFLLLLLVGLTHLAHLSPSSSAQDLEQLFQRLLPPGTVVGHAPLFAAIERFFLGLVRARTKVSFFALPLFLWFATRLFASIRVALTLVYDVPRRPGDRHFALAYLAGKLRDAAMVGLMVLLASANAVIGAGLRVLNLRGQAVAASIPSLAFLVTWVGRLVVETVALGFSLVLFYIVYRHASPRRLPRGAAFAGSVFTAVLFEVAKRLFGWYLLNLAVVSRFSADANIGAAILFVLWLYYTALVFLVGAVVAETWDLWNRQRASPRPIQLAGQ
ncbi:MAG TPA: YhjD/YihY/BrkB family envelope integrity protein [Gemmatimonadales bacterium]|nr:YhjD/YihY/BrkB family envelope integrity protein [Gemmatimonadales bacterium]